jgi:hypothetical protein
MPKSWLDTLATVLVVALLLPLLIRFAAVVWRTLESAR